MIKSKTMISILILLIFNLIKAQNTSQLKLVIEFFRHGARAPLNTTFDKSWNGLNGELTPTGMRMQYLLGAAIKNDYPDLLGQGYDSLTKYAQSTDFNRTIMSTYSQLYGVFQGAGPQLNLTGNLTYPPFAISQAVLTNVTSETNNYALPNGLMAIPVYQVPTAIDTFLLSSEEACPIFNTVLYYEGLNTPEVMGPYGEYEEVIDEINKAINMTLTGPDDLITYSDTVISNFYEGKPIPGNFSNETSKIWNNITFAFGYFAFASYYGSYYNTSIYAIPMFNQLIDYLNQTVNGTSQLNFMFFGAHDTTLALILAALNITTTTCLWDNFWNKGIINDTMCHYPSFASNIKLELWYGDINNAIDSENPDDETTIDWYIRFYYDDELIQIPGCDINCTFYTFKQILYNATGNQTIDAFNEFCGVNPPNVIIINDQTNTDTILIIILGSISFIMIVISILMMISIRNFRIRRNSFNATAKLAAYA